MKNLLKKQYWGWGLHVDREGNLHDVFPRSAEKRERPRGKWHVKPKRPKLKKALAMNHS